MCKLFMHPCSTPRTPSLDPRLKVRVSWKPYIVAIEQWELREGECVIWGPLENRDLLRTEIFELYVFWMGYT